SSRSYDIAVLEWNGVDDRFDRNYRRSQYIRFHRARKNCFKLITKKFWSAFSRCPYTDHNADHKYEKYKKQCCNHIIDYFENSFHVDHTCFVFLRFCDMYLYRFILLQSYWQLRV